MSEVETMDCTELLTRIEALTAGTLSAEERLAVDGHLGLCARCREIAEVMRTDLGWFSAVPPAGLAESILDRTSGRPCNRALERLGDHLDGALDGVDRDLVQGHLDHCGACSALSVVMTRLADDLPALAELRPDPGFTGDVLAALDAHDRSWLQVWDTWWPGLLGRSRLAWEAGYIGAIVLWVVFGASWAPLRATSQRALAAVQENHVRSAVETMRSTLKTVTRRPPGGVSSRD